MLIAKATARNNTGFLSLTPYAPAKWIATP
jgi:hypothetical protein